LAPIWEAGNPYRILVRKSLGKRPFGRPRTTCKDNIKMNLREIGYEGGRLMGLAQDCVQ